MHSDARRNKLNIYHLTLAHTWGYATSDHSLHRQFVLTAPYSFATEVWIPAQITKSSSATSASSQFLSTFSCDAMTWFSRSCHDPVDVHVPCYESYLLLFQTSMINPAMCDDSNAIWQ